ncbi:MAG: right-handed parallel beta-helix repeat-containing protein, partial [Euryarchaeota archaeon]|nr:right-handed parallel beta-helix repeat-containing protein [Euryarchaeota archaeon]
ADGAQLTSCDRCTILKNSIHDNEADGLHIADSKQTLISGNEIWNNGEYGVQIHGLNLRHILTHNVIRNCGSGGIYIYEGQIIILTDNSLVDNQNFNAQDNDANQWEHNFYSDYMGSDLDGDGFGDEPYVIYGRRGAFSVDPKPLMTAPGVN